MIMSRPFALYINLENPERLSSVIFTNFCMFGNGKSCVAGDGVE